MEAVEAAPPFLRVDAIFIFRRLKNVEEELYVERREDGDYAIRPAQSVRATFAIHKRKRLTVLATLTRTPIHVERVRHTYRGNPDAKALTYQ